VPSLDRFVSTGNLPARDRVAAALSDAYARFLPDRSGRLSDVYPALTEADPDAFGLAVVAVTGERIVAGDADSQFTIMSVAKPFVFAVVAEAVGIERIRLRVGVNATGLPFNSSQAVERDPDGRSNPMVNAGAIATTGLWPGPDLESRWEALLIGLSRFAGRDLAVDEATLASARETNHRNRGLANLLAGKGALDGDPADAVDLYTRQSCVLVSAVDLAVMGATLADGGVNPLTREHVVDPETARATLAVMAIAGLYETSGDWLFDVGMPGKSGIGGGIVTVTPGKGALGTFSPPLDDAGNSVRGQLAARHLTRVLGLDLLASDAHG
jgi:glutaminase